MTPEKITALSRSNYKDEELLCHITHKSFKVKTKLVTFRLDRKLLNKVRDKLSTGDISMTDYLRRLIEKDIG
jgi:predicted DNA binding CopG/RHH family protein